MTRKIIWFQNALTEMKDIGDYIGAKRNTQTAAKELEKIRTRTKILKAHPEIAPPGRVPGTRELFIAPHYLVIYQLAEKNKDIFILSVTHTSRNYPENFH